MLGALRKQLIQRERADSRCIYEVNRPVVLSSGGAEELIQQCFEICEEHGCLNLLCGIELSRGFGRFDTHDLYRSYDHHQEAHRTFIKHSGLQTDDASFLPGKSV